jgi:hypothetical protein
MNEILDRIAAALEKQTELLAKSVALQEEGCVRSREMQALNYEHTLLSIERHHLLRMREFLALFAYAGAERSTIFPVVSAAYEKWKLAVEDISPEANIGFNVIERIYQNDLRQVQQEILKRIEAGTTEGLSRDLVAALEVVNNFLHKKEEVPAEEDEDEDEDEDEGPDDPKKASF